MVTGAGKLVKLIFEGDLAQTGYRVTLEIGEEGQLFDVRELGQLPADDTLADLVQHHWQEAYRSVEAPSRIKNKKIILHRPLNERIAACQASATKLEQRMNAWLQSDSFRTLDQRLRTELSVDEPVRVLISCEQGDPLEKLPWHEWNFFESFRQAEPGFSNLRYQRATRATTFALKSKIKILVILGHATDLNLDADVHFLESLPQAELKIFKEPKAHEINDQLWDQPWDIIFFAGHSETEGDTGKIYLNPQDSLKITDLWYGLRKAVDRGLQLAIFNSCDGLGLAHRLDDLHIPQVIVMRDLVPDRIAHEFLSHFLKAFVGGQPLYQAVREARQRLQIRDVDYLPCVSWLPIIYQNPLEPLLTWNHLLERLDRPDSQTAASSDVPPPSRRSKRERLRRGLQQVLIISLIATFLVMGVRHSGLLQEVELAAYDQMMRSRPSDQIDDRIVIVTIDDQDLKLQDKNSPGYSLRHDDLERLIKRIKPYQPAIVATAVVQDKVKVDVNRYPILANYLQTQRNYINVCWVSPSKPADSAAPPPELLATPQWQRFGFGDYLTVNERVLRRQLFKLKREPESSCPAQYPFSIIVGFNYLEVKGKLPDWYLPTPQQTANGNNWNLDEITTKEIAIGMGGYQQESTDTGGQQILLNYRAVKGSPSKAFAQYSLRTILGTDILERNPSLITGKIVLIGSISITNAARKLTPYGEEIQAVIIYAQEISQLLDYAEGKRPLIWVWQAWQEAFWLLGWAVVGSLVGWFSRDWRYWGLGEATTLIILYQLSQAIFNAGIWAPIVPSILVVVLCSFALYIQVHQRKMG